MKQGFTLIELLVVILIIGILIGVALPDYGRAVERTRMTEAIELLNSIAKSQRRKEMQTSKYANDYRTLDLAPKGASGNVYYTRGNPVTGDNCNGFRIELETNGGGQLTASRYAPNRSLEYQYDLSRVYINDNTTCTGLNSAGKAMCSDICGVDIGVDVCCTDGTEGECQN